MPIKLVEKGWVVIQLADGAEYAPVADVQADFARHLPDGEFLFPATHKGKFRHDHPLSSYVFVKHPKPQPLARSRFVATLLRATPRELQRISQKDLDRMLKAPVPSERLSPGMTVRIEDGDWSGLEATVIDVLTDGQVSVRVVLHSRTRVLKLARSGLQIV